MPIVQNINSLVVPNAYVQIVPPQPVIQGIPTNVLGLVGIASYGPVNIPVVYGSSSQEIQNFGPVLPQKYDLGSATYLAALQGTQFFIGVRVTDGTDTAATGDLLDIDSGAGAILTSLYTGELANTITAIIGIGSSYTPGVPTYRLTINIQGGIPETFDNIGGSAGAFWSNLINAVNNGQSIARGPSQIVIASPVTDITSILITNPGSYSTLPTVSTTGPGSGATFVVHGRALSGTLVAAGTGYAVNDTITLTGGTFSSAVILTVLTVNAGAILTFSISTPGNYTVLPTNPVAQGSTSGSGSGATFNMLWEVLSVAITAPGEGYTNSSVLVFSSGAATGTLVIGSINAPDQEVTDLSGGTNGNAGVNSATLVGTDGSIRTGMYALRGTQAFAVMLCDADDPTQWPAQSAFSLSQACYVVGTVAAGYQDNISGATTLLQTSGIDNYGFKLEQGDWVQFNDPFNGQIRYVSPQSTVCGILVSQPPFNSSLNKVMSGIVGTQRTNEGNPYSEADLAQLITGRIDVVTNPIPTGQFFGSALGCNTSSNFLTSQDNYPLMANFIGRSLSNAMGIYVGQIQNDTVRLNAKNELQSFLINQFNLGYIGDVNHPGDASYAFTVILDSSNNSSPRVAAGYMQSDTTVTIFQIILFFVCNVNLITGAQQVTILPPTLNVSRR